MAMYLLLSGVIGSEFLPHLDEGAIWVRGTLAPSTGPDRGHCAIANKARVILAAFPKSLRWSARSAAPMTAPTRRAFSIPNTSWI